MDPVSQVMAVTGSTEADAVSFLAACSWDVDKAIELLVANNQSEAFGSFSDGALDAWDSGDFGELQDGEEEAYRAPLPVTVDTLLPSAPGRTQQPPSADALSRADEDWVFLPPTDILFEGTLAQAVAKGRETSKWVLVNLVDDLIFESHRANRDVWSDEAVRDVLADSFLFCQWDVKNPEGEAFAHTYRLAGTGLDVPMVVLIDPVTRVKMEAWGPRRMREPADLIDNLLAFTAKFPSNFDLESFASLSGTSSGTSYGSLEDEDEEEDKENDEEDEEEFEEEGEPIRLAVKLPSGKRERLQIGSKSKVGLLFQRVRAMGNIETAFDLVGQNLSLGTDKQRRLAELDLAGVLLHVQLI